MKKLKLTIELVPSSSWNQNLRSLLKPQMWGRLKKEVYKKYDYKCSICRAGGKLHAHEVWEYDDEKHIQKLIDIIALCSKCHTVKHIGLAGILASQGKTNFKNLVKHFMKVNNCGRDVFEKHQAEAFKKFEERSHYEWQIELNNLIS